MTPQLKAQIADLPEEVLSLVQRGLNHVGLYHGTYRGRPGVRTWEALEEHLSGDVQELRGFKELLIKHALEEVGTVETGGNNRGKRIVTYQKATWLEPAAWPWCAAFVCWLVSMAAKKYTVPFKLPQTAAAFGFEKWARQDGLKLYTRGKVLRGDIVIFDFSHIGVAVSDEKNGYIETVEGNTNKAGSRDGDGVWKKKRAKSLLRSWVRIT